MIEIYVFYQRNTEIAKPVRLITSVVMVREKLCYF